MDAALFLIIYAIGTGLLLSIAYMGYKHPIDPKGKGDGRNHLAERDR
jgi:hypothetical protein